MSLYKRIDGRIRDDVFTNTIPAGYIVSPLNRYTLTGSALQLQHDNIEDVRVLTDVPGICAIEITTDYTPKETGDAGGLILFRDAESTAEFLERSDSSTTQTVARWRAVSNQTNDWDFYSDSGGGFNFTDSLIGFIPKKIGIVLKKGIGNGYVPMDLKRITITAGDRLTVANLTDGVTVELLDEANAILASSIAYKGVVSLAMSRLLVQGKLRIKNGTTVVEELSALFAGGDRYDSGANLKIIVDPTTKEELSRTELTDLGQMTNGILQKKYYLYNPTTSTALNATVAIQAYSDKFGWQWADIARDMSNTPGTYYDEINYPSVAAGAVIPFWIRVVQSSGYDGFDPLKFIFDLSHI